MSNFSDRLKKTFRSKRFWRRIAYFGIGGPILLTSILVMIVYVKQDEIVQSLLGDMNKDFKGKTEIKDSHISLFANFPYISIDLEDFKVYETKDEGQKPLIAINDVYAGFNLWTILTGNMEVKKIKLEDGHIDIVQEENGELNLLKAFETEKVIESTEEEFHLDLKKIELVDIDVSKLNKANKIKIDAFINEAHSKFKTNDKEVLTSLDTKFEFSVIKDGDTTFFKHKHLDIDTEVSYKKKEEKLILSPTSVHLEEAEFDLSGSINFKKDMYLDLEMHADKPDFELFIALAPNEYSDALHEFENSGEISISSYIKGSSVNGQKPAVDVSFSCKNGVWINETTGKKMDRLNFSGKYTNGTSHTAKTMRFDLDQLKARLGAGTLETNVHIDNFKAPDIKVYSKANFDFKHIAKFLNIDGLRNVKGKGAMDISFHDLIDPENPEHMLSSLNESYKFKLDISKLSFDYDGQELPLKNFDLLFQTQGHKAAIKKCNIQLGNTDLSISGAIDDLPAILHHTDIPVDTRISLASKKLDINELTRSEESEGIDEQITNLSLDLDFKASARSFTESKYVPEGEFFIENFYAKLKHYPHSFHDFHADIIIGERDLEIKDFKGMIDKSDFLFTGKLEHYEKWLDEHPGGDSKIEFDLASKMLQLESLFTYQGEHFVPKEYRHEEFDNLHIHGQTFLHFDDQLRSIDLTIDKFEGKMKVHPLRFERFGGRIHYEKDHLVVEDFHGKMGHSDFKTTLHYYLGEDEKVKVRDNYFSIQSSHFDIDELINYNPSPISRANNTSKSSNGKSNKPTVNHDAGFNIYELPFTDMKYEINIAHLNYHRMKLDNVRGQLHTTPDHYLHIDHLDLDIAGGHVDVEGYFNGSDPEMIYFSPTMHLKNVDLDKLLFKFENFGQDYMVSENLHGQFTGTLTGKIHMHADMVPKIDDSEIHMDVDVVHGKLENYALLHYMSDYFKDKNLDKVLFDTLNNHIDLVDGVMTIPKMEINSSLGHMEISGKQDLKGNMEYYMRIPWKMVTKTAMTKLFGRKKSEEELEAQQDEIIYGNEKTKYVSVTINCDENGYNFKLGKKKEK